METKKLTIEEQNRALAETFAQRIKHVCENTIMSHRYFITYWNDAEQFALIEISKRASSNRNNFDEYDMQLIQDLKEELKDISYWNWEFRGNEGIIDLDIKMYDK